jgi:hypothetical protein
MITIIMDILFTLILFFSLVYSLALLFIRRLYHQNNMFILNICLTIISSCIYFIIYFTMLYFDIQRLYSPRTCILLLYAYNIASIEIPFSFVVFSIHRFCSMVYPAKHFFKTKRWVVICIGSQWITQCVVSLPFVLRKESVSIYCRFSYYLVFNPMKLILYLFVVLC